MIVKDVELTLLKINLKEGVGKVSKKDYKFYVASVVDTDGNVFNLNISEKLTSDEKQLEIILPLKQARITAQIEFKPKGFDIAGSLVDFDIEK